MTKTQTELAKIIRANLPWMTVCDEKIVAKAILDSGLVVEVGKLEDAEFNYAGAMADLDALVEAFRRAAPDNYFLNANYPLPTAPQVTQDVNLIELRSAASSLIGYAESLSVDLGITQGYIERLHNHYIPKLQAALLATTLRSNNYET